jgi:hypothetical protein
MKIILISPKFFLQNAFFLHKKMFYVQESAVFRCGNGNLLTRFRNSACFGPVSLPEFHCGGTVVPAQWNFRTTVVELNFVCG